MNLTASCLRSRREISAVGQQMVSFRTPDCIWNTKPDMAAVRLDRADEYDEVDVDRPKSTEFRSGDGAKVFDSARRRCRVDFGATDRPLSNSSELECNRPTTSRHSSSSIAFSLKFQFWNKNFRFGNQKQNFHLETKNETKQTERERERDRSDSNLISSPSVDRHFD